MRHPASSFVVLLASLGAAFLGFVFMCIFQVSRNPMRSEGCLGILKSVQDNPVSALELLDFSVRAFYKPHHSPVKYHLEEENKT